MRDPEKLFADAIIGWHEACGRHDLPWQVEDWYPRLVSEVMLQQTQVVSVLPKYEAFMTAFPTPECLAAAPDDDVMALWAGLGYYSRARNLLKAVRIIVNEMGGRCPETAAELEKLPGLGPSTAGAVAAFAFRERAVMADSLMRATNRLSTMLYRLFTSMESTLGSAIESSSGSTGRSFIKVSFIAGSFASGGWHKKATQLVKIAVWRKGTNGRKNPQRVLADTIVLKTGGLSRGNRGFFNQKRTQTPGPSAAFPASAPGGPEQRTPGPPRSKGAAEARTRRRRRWRWSQ